MLYVYLYEEEKDVLNSWYDSNFFFIIYMVTYIHSYILYNKSVVCKLSPQSRVCPGVQPEGGAGQGEGREVPAMAATARDPTSTRISSINM